MVFKRKLLSSSVALAIAGYAAPLMAEEEMGAQNATMEEVVVKGIRGSLQRSMDIKRDASGVVDAISAEEMGKFPDATSRNHFSVSPASRFPAPGAKAARSLFAALVQNTTW